MTDNACAHSDPVHTNVSGSPEKASLVFSHLCGGDDGVVCRSFKADGSTKETKRAYVTGRAVSFDLLPNESINIYCSGGGPDDPPCRYDLSAVPA